MFYFPMLLTICGLRQIEIVWFDFAVDFHSYYSHNITKRPLISFPSTPLSAHGTAHNQALELTPNQRQNAYFPIL